MSTVDKENTLTWTWFLELQKHSLNLKDGTSITFMSDMQKGLLEAVRTVLPLSNHRFCVRHIEANWSKRIKISGEMKKYLWWSAWSTYEEDFKDQLKNLGELSVDAAKELLRYPPQNWRRSYFDTLCKNQMVDNNFIESFNSWILEARGKPILKLLEDIRIKVMNRLREKEEEARTWGGEFSPNCMKLYTAYLKVANLCTVHFNGETGYEVSEGGDRHIVNPVEKKCTCRSWQLTGIPWPHTIRALKYEKEDPMTEISWWHSKEAYLMTYRAKLMPVRGESDGSEHESDPALMPKNISEDQTRLLMRQQQLTSAWTRVISFRGDHTGVVIPLIILTHLLSSLGKCLIAGDSVCFVLLHSSAGSLLGSSSADSLLGSAIRIFDWL
ncbi:PREDICTED: uncharacterized protein LOC109244333 [Nicotiana attenuata]|uniref:uncharacterized protein LOC109244333 n=1 Tax=Nicotiana attenuata TaxID=49451 RepID=UPI00090518B2|nr:PREDICTED: uncharacterized protein LOC109244333 [Nicotiana attenuata]